MAKDVRHRIFSATATPGLTMVIDHAVEALQKDCPPGVVPIEATWGDEGVEFTRPTVPGEGLDQMLQPGPLPVSRALEIAIGVLRALDGAHQRNVIHGSIEPRSIIVNRNEGRLEVAVVDWGISHVRIPDARLARYLSPEQTGILEHSVGRWSDLYSVGVILFEMITGAPPFLADKMAQLLQQHLNDEVPSLRERGFDVPAHLEELLARLMAKDPRTRYRTAAGALHDLEAIANGVQDLVIGATDRRTSLADPAFLGRRSDLLQLQENIADAARGNPNLTFVEAPSGGGKTRLMAEVARRAALAGFLVLHGQGTDNAAPHPFGIFEGVIDGLASKHRTSPEKIEPIIDRLQSLPDEAIAALPGLGRLLGRNVVEGDESHAARRTVRALAKLIHIMGGGDQKIVILLDDIQWSDGPSREVLAEWWSSQTDGQVMLVGAFRSEEVPENDSLRKIPVPTHITLAPLDEPEIDGIISSMAGPVPTQVRSFIQRLAHGNPFMATAALRGLVEAEVLVPSENGWETDHGWGDSQIDNHDMESFLMYRFDRLDDATLQLLEVGAVLGKSFDFGLAAQLGKLSAKDALDALANSQDKHLLVATEGEGNFAFSHDKLRESALARLTVEKRRELHAATAEFLRHANRDAHFELAYHYNAAGKAREAFDYALRAAEDARRRLALETAATYYLMAEQGLPDDRLLAVRVYQGIGDTMMLRGDYQDALPWFHKAKQFAQTPLDLAELDGKIADLAFRQGDLEEAEVGLRSALRSLKQPAPKSTFGWTILLIFEAFRQIAHSVLPSKFRGRKQLTAETLLAGRLYSLLAHVYWFMRGPIPCGWAHLREMNILEVGEPTEELAKAYAEHSVVMTTVPYNKRGQEYARESFEMRRTIDNQWGMAHALHFGAISKLSDGKIEAAQQDLIRAERIFDRTGDLWQANNAGWILALTYLRLGQFDDAERTAKKFFWQADRIGDLQNTALSLEMWVKAGARGVTKQMVETELARVPSSDPQSRESAYQMAAVFATKNGDYDGAISYLEKAWGATREATLRSEFVAPIPLLMVATWRSKMTNLPAWNKAEQDRCIAQQKKWLKVARSWAKRYPNNLPQFHRENAHFLALMGRLDEANSEISLSTTLAIKNGMAAEAQMSKELMQSFAHPVSRLKLNGAAATGTSIGQFDRIDSLIAATKAISGARTKDKLVATLIDSASQIYRCDEVLLVDAQTPSQPQLQSVVRGALKTGKPAVSQRRIDQMKSILIIPLESLGPGNCLRVVSQSVEGLFGPREESIAELLQGLVSSVSAAQRDYASLQEANYELVKQTGILESQTEALDQGLLMVDQNGRIISFNETFCQLWGIKRELIASRDDDKVMASVLHKVKDPDAFVANVSRLYEHPEDEQEDNIELVDGRIVTRHTGPVRLRSGQIIGRMWLFRDVTSTVRAHEEVVSSFQRMEQLNEMKTKFINQAAHELNTPLTPIEMQMYVLGRAGELNERQQRAFDVSTRNIGRLRRLVGDLMDVAKAQNNKIKITRAKHDLVAICAEVKDTFAAQGKEEGVSVVLETPNKLEANFDGQRVTQVLVNLVSNAMRFSPRESTISIRASVNEEEVRIAVVDEGLGMDGAALDQLFQPFSQPVVSPAGKPDGTGLGLVICKGIVEAHGGRIWAESPGVGKGTTMRFTLPLAPTG